MKPCIIKYTSVQLYTVLQQYYSTSAYYWLTNFVISKLSTNSTCSYYQIVVVKVKVHMYSVCTLWLCCNGILCNRSAISFVYLFHFNRLNTCRDTRADWDYSWAAPGPVWCAGGCELAARGPRYSWMRIGRHFGCWQGRIFTLDNFTDSDHWPRGTQCGQPGDFICG